ncbi:radial spoke protein 14 [Dunaliella salina]|uniref:Radial spoke protein 14 n=1 Tax=Dunaliella salina TaxID=3046 RepID=A0ABQ7GJU6_DUNSA|nr:radial spoke protein 14 [Dunaliella salina]|eukprot:KAF5834890.1 radial spoke protein 14 [Dunaliella salina]
MTTSISKRDAGIAANLKHIVAHGVRDNPVPLSSTAVTRGFEKAAFPKIVHELQDRNLIVRQKSLLAAQELLGSPINYVQCVAAGITPAVIKLLKDNDALVRERAAGTAEYLAKKELGARDIIQHGGIYQLVACLSDASLPVRDAAYKALYEGTRFDVMRRELTAQKSLVTLMALVLEEQQGRALQGLRILNACTQMRNNGQALEQLIDVAEAISHVVGLLAPEQSVEIQEQGARLLSMLTSQFLEAKVTAVQEHAVPHLVRLLGAQQQGCACAAAAALMMVTVVREGKYAMVDTQHEGGFERLAGALDPRKGQLCTDAMQVVCNVAEAPEGREALIRCGVPHLLAHIHQRAENGQLKGSAAEAIRQCRFKCFP